ncbi:MAG: MlaD family protein [Bacteroidales bacterium]|nr:MlaD family protein [Bacteroidales bacterium]
MKKVLRKEFLIGILVLAALAILVFGIDFLKGVNVFQPTNYYYVTYTDVEGLATSAPVTVNGFKVGQVRDISYEYDNPGHIRVELALDSEMKLPVGTRAMLVTDMLGTSTIALDLATGANYYKAGDKLDGDRPKGLMAAVSEDILPSVGAVLPKVDSLLTTVTDLAGDPALLASIKRMDAITANLEASTAKLNQTISTLGPITSDVKNITGNFVAASGNISEFSTTVKDLPIDSLMNELQATTTNLKALSQELNNPNSTIGKLTKDPALYNNLNSTVQSLDSLFTDIKKNPKRYINIKIF